MLTVTAIAGTKGKPGVMNITLLLKQKRKYRKLTLIVRLLNHFTIGHVSVDRFTGLRFANNLPILRLSTDDKKYTNYGKEK